MNTVTGNDLIFAVGDAVAAHNLIHYAAKNDGQERVRLVTGAAMASLGFTFGPELEDHLKEVGNESISNEAKRQFTYAAGGVALGGVFGYIFGNTAYEIKREKGGILENVAHAMSTERPGFKREKPGGLLTIASAGWLGYSLFVHDRTEEMQDRQLWGLGAGVLGYLYAPHFVAKLRKLTLPEGTAQDAKQLYTRGGALLGMVTLGTLGWHVGKPGENDERLDGTLENNPERL